MFNGIRTNRKLLAMQQKAEAQKRKAEQQLGGETQKSLFRETRKGRIVSGASAAGIWSIICPIQNC